MERTKAASATKKIIEVKPKIEPIVEIIPEPIVEIIPEPRMIRFQKIGGGSFLMFNSVTKEQRWIKPGEKFSALPEDVPAAYRDVVIPLEHVPAPVAPVIIKVPVVFTLVPVENLEGFYNVENLNGKVINEKPLDKGEAISMIESLNS